MRDTGAAKQAVFNKLEIPRRDYSKRKEGENIWRGPTSYSTFFGGTGAGKCKGESQRVAAAEKGSWREGKNRNQDADDGERGRRGEGEKEREGGERFEGEVGNLL